MKHKQKHSGLHMKRLGLFFVLLLAFFVVRLDAAAISRTHEGGVLAYATNMSRDGLLAGTNAARAANGLGALAINSQLNNAAQAKAQHMADNNYWAHVAPDGTQPWYFFSQAGYSYTRAGENLAYGFADSQGAVNGWMNSTSHRANVLGSYADVGFGIVNTPNYQNNGEQTIVVAHYGTPTAPAPVAAAPTATPAAPTPVVEPAPTPSEPTPPPVPEPVVAETEPKPTTEAEPVVTPETPTAQEPAPVATAKTSRISVLSMLATRHVPFAALSSLLLVGFAATGLVLTHRTAFRQTVHAGEHFVAAHPGIDTVVVAAVASLILLTTYGNIG